jgi:hypothetical protein
METIYGHHWISGHFETFWEKNKKFNFLHGNQGADGNAKFFTRVGSVLTENSLFCIIIVFPVVLMHNLSKNLCCYCGPILFEIFVKIRINSSKKSHYGPISQKFRLYSKLCIFFFFFHNETFSLKKHHKIKRYSPLNFLPTILKQNYEDKSVRKYNDSLMASEWSSFISLWEQNCC